MECEVGAPIQYGPFVQILTPTFVEMLCLTVSENHVAIIVIIIT